MVNTSSNNSMGILGGLHHLGLPNTHAELGGYYPSSPKGEEEGYVYPLPQRPLPLGWVG